MRKAQLVLVALLIFSLAAAAEEPKKVLTRADVIEKLSTADFLKKKIGDMLNWNVGYDITKMNRTNLAPTISFIKMAPIKVPPDNRTVVLLTAKVSDPSGPDNIRGVRADLSSIKKLPNMMLVDNGLWGDSSAGDGVYTLQTNVGYDVQSGTKDIPVAVSNKLGWVALGTTDIDIQLHPIIHEAKADPSIVNSNADTQVKLTVVVENPGRQEDMKEVAADLINIGGDRNAYLKSASPADRMYSITITIKKGTKPGTIKIPIRAGNIYEGKSSSEIVLEVK